MPERELAIIRATPSVLRALLANLPSEALEANEGPGTWGPRQVLYHFLYGETDDWIPRVRIILEHGATRPFTPFDREGGFATYGDWPLPALLDEFERLRQENVRALEAMQLTPDHLKLEGMHPELGKVTMAELLACWAFHDMDHLWQLTRILARHCGRFIGPWQRYSSLFSKR